MSGEHAKREMETGEKPIGDKPTTSHGKLHRKSPATKRKGRKRNLLPTSRIEVATRKRR
jgi:hypothetical protein